MKIGLDLAEILRISKLDWHDGGEGEKGRREEGGILLCNGLINAEPPYTNSASYSFEEHVDEDVTM